MTKKTHYLNQIERNLTPPMPLLMKLGSIIAHTEEYFSKDSHAFDRCAMQALLDDQDVQTWLAGMRSLALIPVKRNPS